MCAICGIVARPGTSVDSDQLQRMVATMRHRGPDDSRVFTDRRVGLGHARLSIIDLTGGSQPMSTQDRTLWITFNGEIFNYIELREQLQRRGHKFATCSDTEVILHLYQEEGEKCVQRLNGQWAFGIWDAARQKLFLSRDRLGIRPLFYTQVEGAFLFASEIKGLLAYPGVARELDLRGLNQILTFWTTLPSTTAFRNVSQLPPGHSLVVERDQVRVSRYWSIGYGQSESGGDEDRLAGELLGLLEDSTRIRLRSDVPVGAYLSGGLDSTVTAALAQRVAGERLSTFSVTFDSPEFDESSYQREAVAHLGSRHTEVHCSHVDIVNAFPEVIRHCEQPILRTAPAPLLLLAKTVRHSGFKVVVTGEGADEILGGYDLFKEAKVRRFCGRDENSSFRHLLLKRLYPYVEAIQKQPAAYLKQFFHVTEADLRNPFFSHLPRWELTSKLKLFLTAEVRQGIADDALSDLQRELPAGFEAWPSFHQAEYLEATGLLPGYILSSQGDRMAMASSVEARYPFLDYRVVEFAAKLPPRLKMKVLNEKYLLKRAVRGLLPESIRRRHKQPFRAPDGKSFFSSKTAYVEDMLSPDQIRRDGIFNPDAVSALVQKFKSGRPTGAKDDMALVGILSTQILVDTFINNTIPSASARGCHVA